MAETFAAHPFQAQQFASPGTTIRPQADTVDGQADQRPGDTPFGTDRGDMCLVMRHPLRRNAEFFSQAQCQMGGRKIRMKVMGNDVWPHIENSQQVAHCFFEEADGCCVVEAADMLRQEGLAPLHDANGVLHQAAQREHRRPIIGERDGHRHIAAGAPNEGRPGTQHRIVTTNHDVAVVQQVGISNAGQPFERLGIGDDQRFAVRIGAGHDQQQIARLVDPGGTVRPPGRFMPEQQVQRGAGQHRPEPGQTGRDAGQFARAFRTQHDGRRHAVQQFRFILTDTGEVCQRGSIQTHHCKRLGLALLALAQLGHRVCIARIAGKMKPAHALDSDNVAGTQQAQGFGNRITGQRLSGCIQQAQLWPAIRAAGGFGMKTAVARCRVFVIARRTERKPGEAGLRPIVGNSPAHRVTRPTMGAGGKGVAPAAIGRVAEVSDALRTYRRVRPDGGFYLTRFARQDGEAITRHLGRLAVNGIDPRQARGLAPQPAFKLLPILPFDRSNHPSPIIVHPARQTEFVGEPPDEGPEADTLNESANSK